MSAVSLRAYVGEYVACRDVSSDYAKQLLWSVERLERFAESVLSLADLSDDLINRWIVHMLAQELSRRTVRSQRANLLTLWRDAWQEGKVESAPRKVRKVGCPKLIPDASPPDRIARLLGEAQKLTGFFQRSKVSRSAFWIAFILVIWETGLRLGDMLRLTRDHINDGVLSIVQSKTGWPLVVRLSPQCLAAIAATDPENRVRIFGDALSRGRVQKGIRRLLASVGLTGGTKRIRRSGATAVESLQQGAAMRYLGHRTPGLSYQYYVDPRHLRDERKSPPPLAG